MAIQNASDLLVYKRTTPAQKQITRIRVKTSNPLTLPDGSATGTIKGNNIVNAVGTITDEQATSAVANNGSAVLVGISAILTANGYEDSGSDVVSGSYTYREYTNAVTGAVPLLSFSDGTATIKANSIKVEIKQQGQSLVYEPVAFSTSASINVNADLRDITNKDSQGVAEYLMGQKSYEVSTDALVDINANVDAESFIGDIRGAKTIHLKYSDRIRNLINTSLSQSGVDGFLLVSATEINLQDDPFGGKTASKVTTSVTDYGRLRYDIVGTVLENKNFVWSCYIKGTAADQTTASINFRKISTSSSSAYSDWSIKILSGSGTATKTSSTVATITGLGHGGAATANWTRIEVKSDNPYSGSAHKSLEFRLLPDVFESQTIGDSILTSSWQIELGENATAYQSPANISCYSGQFLPTSVTLDAGVEDNATYSASFNGSGELYKDGLGPELIGDTDFDDGTNWWSVTGTALIENGYGKVISNGTAAASIYKNSLLTSGVEYSLTYTVNTYTEGVMVIEDGYDTTDLELPSSVGTHTVILKPSVANFILKRKFGEATTIWLSSISLKKLAPVVDIT